MLKPNLVRANYLVAILGSLLMTYSCSKFDISPEAKLAPTEDAILNGKCVKKISRSSSLNLAPGQSWENSIFSIFVDNCSSCHGEEFEDYSIVKTKIELISKKVASGEMPQDSALDPKDKEAILTWINIGAPQKTVQPLIEPTPIVIDTPKPIAEPTIPKTDTSTQKLESNECSSVAASGYKADVVPIFVMNCKSCHNNPNSKSRPYLGDSESLKRNYKSVLSTLKSGKMPKGATKLSDKEIQIFEGWELSKFAQ